MTDTQRVNLRFAPSELRNLNMTNFAKRLAVHSAKFAKRLRRDLWGNEKVEGMCAITKAKWVNPIRLLDSQVQIVLQCVP